MNTQSASEPKCRKSRKEILHRVHKAIRKHRFTASELSIPSEGDTALVLLAADDFPIKLPFTKLAIICLTGSRGIVYRHEIMSLLSKDYTTISHSLSDLKTDGLLWEEIEPSEKSRVRLRKYTLSASGQMVFEHFIESYQRKVAECVNQVTMFSKASDSVDSSA